MLSVILFYKAHADTAEEWKGMGKIFLKFKD